MKTSSLMRVDLYTLTKQQHNYTPKLLYLTYQLKLQKRLTECAAEISKRSLVTNNTF